MLTLADGRTKLAVLTTEPTDAAAIPAATLTGAIDGGQWVNKTDFRMSPTDSDTVPDQPLAQSGNATTYGNGNFEARMTVLRDLDEDGVSESGGDELWAAVNTKGTRIWLVKRVGPVESQAWAQGDEYLWAEVITDDPQEPQDMAGYVKHIVPLGPQAWGRGVVAA